LKEGWDNPNVFQICTLNQTVSEMKKRQEIGRGLRIPVNQNGERVFDYLANILTVIANESYDMYARRLQTEYQEAGYYKTPPPPTRADQTTVFRNQSVYRIPQFEEFWKKLCKKPTYQIKINSDQLINDCILNFNSEDVSKLKPKVVVQTGKYVITRFTVNLLDIVEDDTARLKVKIDSTERQTLFDSFTVHLSKGEKLSDKINKDQRLRGFRIKEIHGEGDNSYVVFNNDIKLYPGESTSFESQTGGALVRQTVSEVEETWPVFNILDRVAESSALTRKSVNRILQEIDDQHLQYIFKNPEGFSNLLIHTIKEVLANHIVEHIEFNFSSGRKDFPLDEFFPPERKFPQHELIDGGDTCIYDKVQIDSEVEKRFVQANLTGNDPKVIAYFKFPSSFKIDLPKILGNYNPDWGILRENEAGNVILQLVRETKGQEEIDKLRFPHEGRKVRAAQKHFKTINLDYRVITDKTPFWWRPAPSISEDSDKLF
jgi:type III restriction enzyme